MKDMRRWGTAVIAMMLVLSMSASMAHSTVGTRRGSDRPMDDGGGDTGGLIDGLGEPDWGGGRNQPYVEPDFFVVALKINLNRLGFRLPILTARPAQATELNHASLHRVSGVSR